LHFNFLKDLSSQILQKCTQPGMLSKLDLLSPNVTIQEFYEVDKPQVADKNELINNLVDSFKKLKLEEGLSTENNENKIENSKSPFKIKDDKKAEILESNTKSLPEKPEMIEQKINIETKLIEKPSTTTKAKLSKKKRDQEKKKNLELKNLEKKSVEEISDNKIEEIEGEGLTSSQPKIINENTISKLSDENTISEDLEEEKQEGAKIEEQKPIEKPIMKNLENKVTKSSKGKGKASVNKNNKPGKKDKKEVINKIIKEDGELKTNNELTLFEENNELIDVLTEKKHWKNLRKSNFIIDRTVSLEEAIADIKKIVELWNKNAFTLISGSYLLNINSVESDVDFIVVLPFNYNDNNGKFVTKIMLDDEFMGIRSECNFEKREECSEKKSLYCVLCESKATSWLRKITAGVSEINATIYNYSFDLAFIAYPWERNSEQVLNFIKSEESLKNLNEIDNFILNFTQQFGTNLQFDRFGMINSLSGYRANIRINELIAENKDKFRLALLTLKLWARS
uniref:Polymerase nucleotidyl transferase domain-containing protein n=1 Tax=Meloidogyne floridensis TaxID=298350 RepID=A0A915NRK5_9BILA